MNERNDVPTTSDDAVVRHDGGPPTQPCPACQAAVEAGAKFCCQCGNCLTGPAIEEPAPSPEPLQEAPAPPPPSAPPVQADHTAEQSVAPPPAQAPSSSPSGPEPEQVAAQCNCCGQELEADHSYCHQCGASVGQPQRQYQLKYMGQGQSNESVLSMTKAELTIGKLDQCDLVIRGDDYVSRRHARLFQSDGMVLVEDTGSANGTFLRIGKPTLLEAGDEILIGTGIIQLQDQRKSV